MTTRPFCASETMTYDRLDHDREIGRARRTHRRGPPNWLAGRTYNRLRALDGPFCAPRLFCRDCYCCFGAAGGLAAGAVSPGVIFLVLVLVLAFFFGVVGSATGA